MTAPKPSRHWRNGPAHYGLGSQLLHWSVALLIVAAVVIGLISGSMGRDDPARDPIVELHKSIGLTALGLIFFRVAWILRSPAPALSAKLSPWERLGAKAAHRLLYALMLLMPLSGLMLSQSAGREVSLFGLVTLPQIFVFDPSVPPGERPLVIAGAILHKTVFELMLYAVLAAHVAGALKHRFIDRDRNALARMWNSGRW